MRRKKDKEKLDLPEILLATGNEWDLEHYCNVLNPDWLRGEAVESIPENTLKYLLKVQEEIRQLTLAWFASGSHVQRLYATRPELERAISKFPLYLVPGDHGNAWLRPYSIDSEGPHDPKEVALGHFVHYLLNPYNHRLAGPCRKCGKFYLKKTKRQTTYCSTNCGRKFTALEAQNARAKRERAGKIKTAQKSIVRWAKGPRRKSWIEYVHQATNVSKAFLTRSRNRGELVFPQ